MHKVGHEQSPALEFYWGGISSHSWRLTPTSRPGPWLDVSAAAKHANASNNSVTLITS